MTQLSVDQAFQIALEHQQAGRLAHAERLYRQILALQPSHAEALHLLGLIAAAAGRNDAAADLIRRAIAVNPNNADAQNNLGNVFRGAGRLEEAVSAFHRAIALKPDHAGAYSNLGNALKEWGKVDDAIAACRQAIALAPSFAEAHYNHGVALQANGQMEDALAAYRRAIALRPAFSQAHCNLGVVLLEQGEVDEAVAAFRQAIVLNPNDAESHSNLGLAMHARGQIEDAIAAFRRAIALNSTHADAHLSLALALLVKGDFPHGFVEYEWRSKARQFAPARRNFHQPLWDGRPLPDATLLLHAEQGFGDTIQFIRYLPLAVERAPKIILECPPELRRLIEPIARGMRVLSRGESLPAFDVHCPLLSLPRIFGTTLETIPREIPYLKAEAALAEKWRDRLAGKGNSPKVGLAWAGRKTHRHDHNRSMPLSAFAPLAQLPAIRFVSLQKGAAADQMTESAAELQLIDWTGELHDFADTAALIADLDLVISVDTAVAHLAGAMGKPVWTLLPFSPDWRWLLNRQDSPWYPTMRLFRQPAIGNWDSVIRAVAIALQSNMDDSPSVKTDDPG